MSIFRNAIFSTVHPSKQCRCSLKSRRCCFMFQKTSSLNTYIVRKLLRALSKHESLKCKMHFVQTNHLASLPLWLHHQGHSVKDSHLKTSPSTGFPQHLQHLKNILELPQHNHPSWGKSFLSTLASPACRLAMPAGNCIVWNMAFSQTARCHQTKPSEEGTIRSTHFTGKSSLY